MRLKIVRFVPKDWNRIKTQMMYLENKCFPPAQQMTEQETKECMTAPGAVAYLATNNGAVIGNTYGNVLSTVDKEWFDGHWDPATYKRDRAGTVYITSTAVHPIFRRQGIARKLKIAMIRDLKRRGFRFVVGHAHKGPMLKLNESLGARVIKKFPHWYGSKQTHYLYEIEL